ncbi:GAF domain-containing protein [Conexibacter sp. DBS9H8]|uniref:helix-turn-helix domain-containing protein n=1 Tax=Conexibacter sp. DBS9H8 TaxID=2937801 RepID=UPI00200CE89B|nr:GAF domain-containing protein [Conexibacter sp. DBS9H8]
MPIDAEPHRRAIDAHASVVRALKNMTTVDDVLHVVAGELCRLVGATRCSVYLKDGTTGVFRGRVGLASVDINGRVRQLIAGVEADRFTREILETGRPVLLQDARLDPRPVRATMRAWGVRSMLGLPLVRDAEVIGLAFVDDEQGTHRFTEVDLESVTAFGELAGGAITHALSTVGAREDLRVVTRQNELLRRAAALDERLTRLAVEGGGLGAILSVVAERTGKPVAVLDEHQRPLLVAPCGKHAEALRAHLDQWGHRELCHALDGLGAEPSIIGPFPAVGIHNRLLVTNIQARGDMLGHLVMTEIGSQLTALDRHALRRAAVIAALELTAQRRVVEAERDSREALLSDLIRGDRDASWLLRRGAQLGLDLDQPHAVCVMAGIAPAAPPEHGGLAGTLAAALGVAAIASIAVDDTTVLLLPLQGPGRVGIDAIRNVVSHTLGILGGEGSGLVAAISDPVAGPGDVHHAHGEATQILRCQRTVWAAGSARVLTAKDLGAGSLFLSSVDRREADQFARRWLGPLLVPEVGGELMDTVQEFFACGRGIRLTASSLAVHENTIRYRFAKVKELTGLDIYADADDQTTALLALRVLQLQGLRPWRLKVSPGGEVCPEPNRIAASHQGAPEAGDDSRVDVHFLRRDPAIVQTS